MSLKYEKEIEVINNKIGVHSGMTLIVSLSCAQLIWGEAHSFAVLIWEDNATNLPCWVGNREV